MRCGGCDVGSCPGESGQVLSCSNCTKCAQTWVQSRSHQNPCSLSASINEQLPVLSRIQQGFRMLSCNPSLQPQVSCKVLGSKNAIGVAWSGPARDPCQVVNSKSVPCPGSSLTRRTSLLCRSHFDNLLPASQLSAQISAMACLDYSDPTQRPVPRNTPADMVLPSHGTAVESLASSEIKWRLRATLAPQLRAGLAALKRSKLSADVRLPLPPIEAHFPADDI